MAGVDSSTQSTKVLLRDAETGRVLGQGTSPHPMTSPPVSEQDPEAWWAAFTAAFDRAVSGARVSASEIAAISVAAQCHGLVALDRGDRVIRPAKLWNDTTSAPDAAELLRRVSPAEWARRTGSVPTAAFTITKLAWLRRNEPAHFAALHRILLPHDWLTFRLTGHAVTDRSDASGTGWFDSVAGTYDHALLALLGDDTELGPMLPRVLGPEEPAGTVLPDIADALGLKPGVLVGPGAGDQHASALGLGIAPGEVVYSLGTSGVVFTVSHVRPADAAGIIDGVADAAGGYLPLVSTLNSAKVTDSMARLLGVDHAELSALALRAPVHEDRPVFAAFLDGERKPNRPAARGVLYGLDAETSRESLALAAFEGVVFGLLRGHRALQTAGVPVDGGILAVGGLARSEAAAQVLANATGRAVEATAVPEAVAAGAAVQAAAVLHGSTVQAVREAWRPERRVVAEATDAVSESAFERYLRLADWTGMEA